MTIHAYRHPFDAERRACSGVTRATRLDDFPALDRRPVTEGHARICAERGHATHTVDGADSGACPRCGEVTGS